MPLDLLDRLRGAMALAAYGDALGAPQEHEGLQGNALPVSTLGRLTTVERGAFPVEGHRWGNWFTREDLERVGRASLRGVPTDDTAYRIAHLHRWIQAQKQDGVRLTPEMLDETTYFGWLNANPTPHAIQHRHAQTAGAAQAASFACMYESATEGVNCDDSFYKPGYPVFFGPFLYLDLALTAPGDPERAFRAAYRRDALEQEEGVLVSAVISGLAAETLGFDDVLSPHTPPDVFEEMDAGAHALLGLDGLDPRMVDWLFEIKEDAIQFVDQRAGVSDDELAQAFAETTPPTGNDSGLWAFRPALLWWQWWFALRRCRARPVDAIALLAAGPGDSDTVPSFLGLVLGARLGHHNLQNAAIQGVSLREELAAIDESLSFLFGSDTDALASNLANSAQPPPIVV